MTFLVLVLGGLLVVGGIGYLAYASNKKRQAALALIATNHRWSYADPGDQGWVNAFNGAPFGLGHSRGVDAEISGAAPCGKPFALFDYHYVETESDGQNSQEHTYNFHVLAIQTGLAYPALFVSHENSLVRMWDAISGDDIDLEDEQFNRKYRVRSSDRKFANDILTPRTMEALKGWPYGGTFSWQNGYLLWSTSGRWDPPQVETLVSNLDWFVTAIPSFLYDPNT